MTTDQYLWKVEVLCEGLSAAVIGKKKSDRLVRRYTKVLVHAAHGCAAMEAAKKYADSNSPPDVEWKLFTPLNAARFTLPMALEDFS